MNRNAILNAMEKTARATFDRDAGYRSAGKRGVMVVHVRDEKNPDQWDASSRSFGEVFRFYQYDGELVVGNGTNFEALVQAKVAYTKRTGQASGINYYQVLGQESFWPGAVISEDSNCICAFAGFSAEDDVAIAKSGLTCYESLKRTGKSLVPGSKEEKIEDEEDAEAGAGAGALETI